MQTMLALHSAVLTRPIICLYVDALLLACSCQKFVQAQRKVMVTVWSICIVIQTEQHTSALLLWKHAVEAPRTVPRQHTSAQHNLDACGQLKGAFVRQKSFHQRDNT